MSAEQRKRIYEDIEREREAQDKQWGGSSHDDLHDFDDWVHFILHQLAKIRQVGGGGVVRLAYLKTAALAVAALESIDRKVVATLNRHNNRIENTLLRDFDKDTPQDQKPDAA